MENLFPNGSWSVTGGAVGQGAKFSAWTPTVATGTVLVHTYSATSGPDSTPGLLLSCTGTSATLSLVSPSFNVPADSGFLVLSVICKCSNTANSTLIPWSVTFTDTAANTVVTTAAASAAAGSTSAIQYNTVVGVPVGSSTAVVTFGAYNWTSTGGYTVTYSSPQVLVG
jgi:hypothetical protein